MNNERWTTNGEHMLDYICLTPKCPGFSIILPPDGYVTSNSWEFNLNLGHPLKLLNVKINAFLHHSSFILCQFFSLAWHSWFQPRRCNNVYWNHAWLGHLDCCGWWWCACTWCKTRFCRNNFGHMSAAHHHMVITWLFFILSNNNINGIYCDPIDLFIVDLEVSHPSWDHALKTWSISWRCRLSKTCHHTWWVRRPLRWTPTI